MIETRDTRTSEHSLTTANILLPRLISATRLSVRPVLSRVSPISRTFAMARGKPIKQDSPESSALSDLSDVDVKAKKGRNGDKAQAKRKVATKSTPADPPSKRARTTKAKAEPKPDPLEDDTEEELDKPAAKQGKAASSSDSKPKRLSKKDKEDEQFSVESIAKHPPRSGPAGAKHKIGAHTSTSGGPEFALLKASELGANALAMFLKNQRRWESKDLEQENITRFRKMMLEKDAGGLDYGSDYILPHGSYLINLGNPDDSKREVSYKCFLDDLQRCEQLGIKLYNWHPGSTVGACTKSEALKNVAESINRAHGETKNVICVIENMAGTGNILGATWEELAEIIDGVKDKSRVGVCIDTCHAFAAGYDIRTKEKYEETIQKFDDVVGLQYLKGMHINVSTRIA